MKAMILTCFLCFLLTGSSFLDSLLPKEEFFCRVNGEKFRPEKDDSPVGGIGSTPLRVEWYKDKKTLFISVRDSPREIGFIILFPNEQIEVQSFLLKPDINASKAYFTPSNSHSAPVENIISQEGTFTVSKIDGYNLSGTFEFTCKSAKNGKEYTITKGEFNDISYY
ncbi:hypothetical protein [Emticicia agri]|uniref:Ig-like domain-containing protein n=1 Tax=Emticicia agri TaxID=2492393 RepID=A0A4Q5M2M2_9BACT|nr:hypothetical protein [Emticicia agri]RYU96564.1 hypothetical protein EWM59_05270 [Emticicia agri]